MVERRCLNCDFWQLVELHALPEGECRRHAPRMQGDIAPHGNSMFQNPPSAIWPQCNRRDWCGEFQQRVEKEAQCAANDTDFAGLRLAARQRCAEIVRLLRVNGRVNRAEIMAFGEVTSAQAAADIATVNRRFPDLMVYDRSAKTYRLAEQQESSPHA
jgi:hypothetical protein